MDADLQVQSYLAGSIVFHLHVLLASAWILWRWTGRLRTPRAGGWWLLYLAADTTLFATVLLVGSVFFGFFAPGGVFQVARYLAQGIFGEGIALAASVTFLHLRAARDAETIPHWAATLRRRTLLPASVTLILLGVYGEAYHHGPYNLQVRSHLVDLTNGKPETGRFRILHLSDIQTHRIGGYEERVFQAARDLKADLVIYTGDYIQPRLGTSRREAEDAFNRLVRRMRLSPSLGSYAVPGDSERVPWKYLFADTEVTCLDREAAVVGLRGGRTLEVVGLANFESKTPEKYPSRWVEAPKHTDYRLVIGHSPDFVRKYHSRAQLDLALAGHTHGGQVVLPFLGPPITFSRLPRKIAAGGLHRYEKIWLHISRGIGMERHVGPQIRFLCPPEICVLEVRY